MNRLLFPRDRFLADYSFLKANGGVLDIPIHLHSRGEDVDLLVSPSSRPGGATPASAPFLRLSVADSFEAAALSAAPSINAGTEPLAMLFLGTGALLGRATGYMRMGPGDDYEPLHDLYLVGPGLEHAPLAAAPLPRRRAARVRHDRLAASSSRPDFTTTFGALGPVAGKALPNLSVGIVGAGRMAVQAAWGFVRSGVGRLILIDPDQIEDRDRAEGVGSPSDAGLAKVLALRNWLHKERPDLEVTIMQSRAGTWKATGLLADEADLIVTAVDRDEPRLQAGGYIATSFSKPYLDLGAGVFRAPTAPGTSQTGDARLVWPGRCLLCAGGLREPAKAFTDAAALFPAASPPADWREQRAGSLASLNAITANVGVSLFQKFASGLLINSTWLRVILDDGYGSIPRIEEIHPPAIDPKDCLCQFSGQGWDSLRSFQDFVARRASHRE